VSRLEQTSEHEFESAPGLPEPLPPGERVLWQGSPDWRALARDAMHLRGLAWYFGVLLLWRGATTYSDTGSWGEAARAVLWLLPLAVAALVILAAVAWLASRASLYTITDRRVVMRVGIVLTITFNLPYSRIEAAGVRTRADGTGDLTLLIDPSDRIAYLHLWPHARPWHVRRAQPMLRALPDAQRVSVLLSRALADSAGVPRSAPAAAPVGQADRPLAGGAGSRQLAA